jgi:hypothetical protein
VKKKKISCFVVPDSESLRDLDFGEVITEDHISKIPQLIIPGKMDREAEEFFTFLMANVGKRIVFVEESEKAEEKTSISLQDAIEKAVGQTQFNRK